MSEFFDFSTAALLNAPTASRGRSSCRRSPRIFLAITSLVLRQGSSTSRSLAVARCQMRFKAPQTLGL